MTKKDLEHLSKDKLQEIFSDFYNNVDDEILKNRYSESQDVRNIFAKYIGISRKTLLKIKNG